MLQLQGFKDIPGTFRLEIFRPLKGIMKNEMNSASNLEVFHADTHVRGTNAHDQIYAGVEDRFHEIICDVRG
jgi:hypothetical protein